MDMRNKDTLARRQAAAHRADPDGTPRRARSLPRFSEEEEPAPRARRSPESSEREPAEVQRSEKIEAYLHYLKMQPPARAEEPATLRHSIAARERFAGRFQDTDAGTGEDRAPRHRYPPRKPLPRTAMRQTAPVHRSRIGEIAIAVCLSLLAGGVAGFLVYDRTSGGQLTRSLTADTSALLASGPTSEARAGSTEQPAPPALQVSEPAPVTEFAEQQTTASTKPIAIAKLEVGDAEGPASAPIALPLKAEPAIADQSLALKLSGIPDSAKLTAGRQIAQGTWMLNPGEEQNVKLLIPQAKAGQFAITVEAIEPRTGELAAPMKEMTVNILPAASLASIEPAAAPVSVARNFNVPEPEPQESEAAKIETVAAIPAPKPKAATPLKPDSAMPIPAPIENTSALHSDAAQGLLRSGDKLMGLGDLSAARQFYAKALDQGLTEAALKLGKTYDPMVFEEKNVQGMKPDPSMAMKYYLQAQASGVGGAAEAISTLDSWMQR
jgi:hypothetical protein